MIRKEHYYKPVRIGNFWSRKYIEYESNGGKNKAILADECPNNIRPHLKYIMIYL